MFINTLWKRLRTKKQIYTADEIDDNIILEEDTLPLIKEKTPTGKTAPGQITMNTSSTPATKMLR